MTAKSAICKALLSGRVITIKTGFNEFGVTNLPREISRMIEKEFKVKVSKDRATDLSRWGVPRTYFRYRLNRTELNLPGIRLMEEYVEKINGKKKNPKEIKVEKPKKIFVQGSLF
jgi:hypothetical protein